tara:strand:+ start:2204 stop:3628 length:1425 start_codon:yes stop_codon:yes gene_type:complete
MALIVADRVQETTNSTGTGAYVLGGAVPGFQTFASEVSNTDTVYYSVTDNVNFEVGLGTYASSGGTITRTTVFTSSNSNSAVNWGVGTKNIFLTYPADKAVIEDASGNVTLGNNLAVGGTVDGRDVATDGTKLDGIATSANNYTHPNHSGEVTSSGDGATVISDNVVDEANLKVSNTPTNGYMLTAQSGNTGGLTWAAASGGGADLYAANESSPSAQPSATGANAIAIGDSAVASGEHSVALTKSRASGADSFAAAIADSASSYGALGTKSIAMGYRAKSTATWSTAIGYSAEAISVASTAIGAITKASQPYSIALGRLSHADMQGKLALSSGGFGGYGTSQTGIVVILTTTTDATPKGLTVDGGTVSSTNQITLPNDSCYGFTGTVIARENSAQTNDFAVWEIKGGAVRAASASTTALGTYNINKISESTGATNWSIALSADTTNGAVAITVTGEASHSIRWVATANTTEVIY